MALRRHLAIEREVLQRSHAALCGQALVDVADTRIGFPTHAERPTPEDPTLGGELSKALLVGEFDHGLCPIQHSGGIITEPMKDDLLVYRLSDAAGMLQAGGECNAVPTEWHGLIGIAQ